MDDEVEPNAPARMHPRSDASSRIHHVLDNTMSAMFGVANDAFQDFMAKALPGFREHYSRAQTKRFD
jgi:hypothetical protein